MKFPRPLFLAFCSSLFALCSSLGAAEKPNVLIIIGDDCTYNDLPVYGGKNAKTPHLEKLASKGLVFNKAYLATAMCQPCRSELYSGLYPMSNGCAWNHSGSLPTVTSMPHHLGDLGYRVGLAGKVHVRPLKAYPFETVAGFDKNCVRIETEAHDLTPSEKFITRSDDPFALVIALVEPHVPWTMGDASQYPQDKLKLPPNLADTPRTRQDFASYLAEITYMDSQIGEILAMLEKTGKADGTLVMFTSEQGSQFPGCKWTNFDTGVHTALIAHWPGVTPTGKRTDALVQYADVLPTLLDAAGAEAVDGQFDGSSFLGVLKGETDEHRKFAYGSHNNIPEGPPYPIRSVTDGDFHYIRNLLPGELYIEKHLMGSKGDAVLNNPYWSTWMRDAVLSDQIYNAVKRYMLRPAEQLFDQTADPYALNNLADDPAHAERLSALSAELDRWLAEEADPGIPLDTHKAHRAAKQLKHIYGPHLPKEQG
ncbi:MAG: sulfatase [Verrucomicrobiota bacterium]